MTNDLILLSAKVQQDGSLFPEYPDNSAVPVNVSYLDEFEDIRSDGFSWNRSKMVAEDGRAPLIQLNDLVVVLLTLPLSRVGFILING